MEKLQVSIHGQWSSRWTFVLAATGSAVGLGNIWRFPYMAGENGGGAFVLLYILCALLIGLPIAMAEIMLGSRGRRNPVHTMRLLALEEGATPLWSGVGWLGVLTGLLILSYYSVIAGWILYYLGISFSGWSGLGPAGTAAVFDGMIAAPGLLLVLHTLFIAITVGVVALGVEDGLDRSIKFMMPMLFALLLFMVVWGVRTDGFGRSVEYLFTMDFSALGADSSVLLAAMGQALFSLSIGMGVLLAYGSYLPQRTFIPGVAGCVVAADTLVALLAGLAIFPLIFSNGLEPAQGPGLIFRVLPLAFGQMSWGTLVGVLFFALLVFAAWTSSISLLEPTVAWLVERHRIPRPWAALAGGACAWVLGIGALLSFNLWQEYRLAGKTFFDLLDYLTTSILIPVGGVLVAVFAAWRLSAQASCEAMGWSAGHPLWRCWRVLARYVAPAAVFLVFLQVTGLLDWLLSVLVH